jgi:HSP20 family protein
MPRKEPNTGKGGKLVKINYENHPLISLHKAVNMLFDDFFMSYEMVPLTTFEDLCTFQPSIDMADDGQTIKITAELPGLEMDEIELCVKQDCLSIEGNKKDAIETNKMDMYCMERSFGNFKRVIKLPQGIDIENVSATYRNGILSVILPRLKGHKTNRRVKINES